MVLRIVLIVSFSVVGIIVVVVGPIIVAMKMQVRLDKVLVVFLASFHPV